MLKLFIAQLNLLENPSSSLFNYSFRLLEVTGDYSTLYVPTVNVFILVRIYVVLKSLQVLLKSKHQKP